MLSAWRRTDAPLLKAAIDANLEHLRQWLPWAQEEPSPLTVIERRIDKLDQRFRADSEWNYAIFSEGEKMLYGARTRFSDSAAAAEARASRLAQVAFLLRNTKAVTRFNWLDALRYPGLVSGVVSRELS